MVRIDKSYAARFARWRVVVDNLAGFEGHLGEDRRRLAELLAEARALESGKARLRAQTRGLRARLRAIADQGDALRRRMGAKLRGTFGFGSEELVGFGFKPRPAVRRRARSGAPPEGEAPGAPPAAEPPDAPAAG